MRISSNFQYESYKAQVAGALERYTEAQLQVSSGKRLNKPSDDPLGSGILLSYSKLRASIEQYGKNVSAAEGYLGFTETALGELTTLTRRAYEFAVRSANGATDQAGRQGMVTEVEEIQRRLIDLGNSRGPQNQFIFAGHSTKTQPFALGPSGITFSGDNNAYTVEVGPNQLLAANLPGEDLFTGLYNALESLKTNLQGGNLGALSGQDIPELQNQLDSIAQLRGVVGSRLNTISNLKVEHTRRIDELTARSADIEEVDMTDAVVKLRVAETAYHAALATVSQGFGLSLIDFIQG